jgi:hypothetical protein
MSDASATTSEYATPTTFREMNIYSWGFFIASIAQLYEAAAIYDYKLYDIYYRKDLFPTRIENVLAFDEDWALQTHEISAWKKMAELLTGLYGTGILLWGINQNYDNEGGFWHNVLYNYASIMRFAPIFTVYQAMQIRNAYARSTEQYSEHASEYADAATVTYRYNPFMYDPAETDTGAISFLDEDDFHHQSKLVVVMLVSVAIDHLTFHGMQQEFEVKREAYLARQEELESLAEYLESDEK